MPPKGKSHACPALLEYALVSKPIHPFERHSHWIDVKITFILLSLDTSFYVNTTSFERYSHRIDVEITVILVSLDTSL